MNISDRKITDPMEKMVAKALDEAGIRYDVEVETDNRHLDFHLVDLDIYIEVKQFHSARISAQMATVKNVIAVQGVEAVRAFCAMLSGAADKPQKEAA